jgi:hypothetical protein
LGVITPFLRILILLAIYPWKFGTSSVQQKKPILYFRTHFQAIPSTSRFPVTFLGVITPFLRILILLAIYPWKFGTSSVQQKKPILYFRTHFQAISSPSKPAVTFLGAITPFLKIMILLAIYPWKFGTSSGQQKKTYSLYQNPFSGHFPTFKTSGHVFGGDYPVFKDNDFAS